jgi:hypothetical protein
MGVIYQTNIVDFLLVTAFLGGGAAYLVGRAIALTWGPIRLLFIYTILLTAAVRFIHYALFHGTLLTLQYFAVDLIILFVLGALGYRITRSGQMASQYGWLYRRVGPLSWQRRSAVGEGAPNGA